MLLRSYLQVDFTTRNVFRQIDTWTLGDSIYCLNTQIQTHKLDSTVLINEQDVKLAILAVERYLSVALRLVNVQKFRLV
ncbi:MAG: hypothetical protein WBV84_06700 [Nitrososphaeraceae archaeon]